MATYVSTHIDEAFSNAFVKHLYDNQAFIPGVTYTDAAEYGFAKEGAGVFHFIAEGDTATGDPETVGSAYTMEDNTDSDIPLYLNNQYSEQVKIPVAAEMATARAEALNKMEQLARKTAQRRGRSALACLLNEAKTAPAPLTTTYATPAAATIKETICDDKAKLSKVNRDADCILVSPAVYAKILSQFGKEFGVPQNEVAAMTGTVNAWLGVNITECRALGAGAALKYINHAGTATTFSAANLAKVNYIMYNHNDFAIMDLMNDQRIFDSERGPWKLCTTDLVSGFRVLRPNCILTNITSAFA